MAWNACIPQTADFYSYRANALHRDESKWNRDGAHRMALCFTHEAMLFSTQNIHLEKSLRYFISHHSERKSFTNQYSKVNATGAPVQS